MANAVYDLWKQEIMKGTANNLLNSAQGASTGVFCALMTASYVFSQAHQFYSSASANIVGTTQEITTKTQALGVFDGDDLTYTAVSGSQVTNFVIYRSTGSNATSPLVLYEDTSVTGLPVTPNGGNITITWNASGIFKL